MKFVTYDTSSCNNRDIVLIKPEFLTIWILEGMTVENKEKNLLTDIYCGNYLNKQEKPVAKAICYNSKILKLVNKKNLILELT